MPESHSWILLTMGDRPAEVARAVESIRAQRVPADEIIVVGDRPSAGEECGLT